MQLAIAKFKKARKESAKFKTLVNPRAGAPAGAECGGGSSRDQRRRSSDAVQANVIMRENAEILNRIMKKKSVDVDEESASGKPDDGDSTSVEASESSQLSRQDMTSGSCQEVHGGSLLKLEDLLSGSVWTRPFLACFVPANGGIRVDSGLSVFTGISVVLTINDHRTGQTA